MAKQSLSRTKKSRLREFMKRISFTMPNIPDEVPEVAQQIIDMEILTPENYDDSQHIGTAVANS